MAKKSTTPATHAAPAPSTDAFVRAVEDALDHFADVHWLGEQSLLAAPYFLGQRLDALPDAEKPATRGHTLQRVLQDAAAQLLEDQQALLRIAFFQTPQAKRGVQRDNAGIALALHLSERSYYRYRAKTIQDLAVALSRLLMPTLRPELPQPQHLVGREHLVAHCVLALAAGESVCITGESGVGKTALGAAIAQAWQTPAVFWHTVRGGLNDRLHGFLFPLAYFLRLHGATHTWQQLVADGGQIEIARVMGLLRFDLAALKTPDTGIAPVLLCIDEVDALKPERLEHAQLLHVLEELTTLVPLCLIGQHPVLRAPHHLALAGLDEAQTAILFARAGLGQLPAAERERVQHVAHGNPAMLTLLMTLLAVGGDLDKTLRSLATAPSMEALLLRVWRYLDETQRGLLMALAVFRGLAPADAWTAQAAQMQQLHAQNLVNSNGAGGICLAPHIQRFVAERVLAEHKPALHARAAAMREQRGETIEAMYHYLEAGQPTLAVLLWRLHSAVAIEHGQAGAALELLQRIAPSALANPDDRATLHIARGTLLRLLGQAEEAENDLRSAITSDDPHLRSEAHLYLAMSLEEQGRIEQAQEQYRAGLQWVSKSLHYQKTRLHARFSRLSLYRLGDLAQAREQSLCARLESLIFSGQVEDQVGNYAAAEAHYRTALSQIENQAEPQSGYVYELSRIYAGLGVLCWRQNNAVAAVQWLEKAIRCDEARGDVFAVAQNHVNLSGAHIIAGQYALAVEAAERGLAIAEPIQATFTIGGLANNAAEASFYLGRYADAEQYVMRSLSQEEEGGRPYALTVLGMVRHTQSKIDEAASLLKEAITSAQATEDKYAEAAAWRALGNAYKDEPNAIAAHDAYAAALKLYEGMGLEKEIAETQALLNPTFIGFQST